MINSVVVIAVVAIVLLAVLAAVATSWRRAKATTAVAESVCGHCGYIVRGLSTFTCPECGSDLRDVGIIRPQKDPRRWADLLWIVPIWTLGCIAIGAILSVLLRKMLSSSSGVDGTVIGMPLMAIIWLGGIAILIHRRRRPLASPKATGTHDASSADGAGASSQPSTTRTAVLTIMFIDMQGYTARAEAASRDGLIDLIRRTRELVQPLLARRRGRLVKTVGDAFLITFESPTEAVLAGREIQQAVARRNNTVDRDTDKIALRIGVTTGEVALEQDDVYGNPVNIANRIQQLAEPGQVYFSEATYHAMTRSEVAHEEVGRFELKGVEQEARIFRVTAS